MYQFLAVLRFYKTFMVWSFIANAIIGFFNPVIVPALITKLFLTVFAWYYVSETTTKRKLTFYKNLGISTFKLFSIIFIVDSLLTVIFLILIREFT